jgi:hypothetical protein
VFRATADPHPAPQPVSTFTMRDRAVTDLARIKSVVA